MILIHEGGEGSGNFGHAGRPGEVGGSSEGFKDLEIFPGNGYYPLPVFSSKATGIDMYIGNGYQEINAYLRGFLKHPETNEPLDGESTFYSDNPTTISSAIKEIDEKISSHTAPENMYVYRGLKKPPGFRNEIGYEFIDKGYVSTSLSSHQAGTFKSDIHFLYRIKVPKGSHGLYIFGNEREFILPRNTRFKIVSKPYSVKSPYDDMEQVDVEIVQ